MKNIILHNVSHTTDAHGAHVTHIHSHNWFITILAFVMGLPLVARWLHEFYIVCASDASFLAIAIVLVGLPLALVSPIHEPLHRLGCLLSGIPKTFLTMRIYGLPEKFNLFKNQVRVSTPFTKRQLYMNALAPVLLSAVTLAIGLAARSHAVSAFFLLLCIGNWVGMASDLSWVIQVIPYRNPTFIDTGSDLYITER